VDALIRERLKGVMSGAIGPYDQKTREALATSQADQAGAAETAQNQALRDQIAMNGGSMNDPSAQAAMRDNLTQRQLANQGSRLNVDMNANLQNFNASQNAAGMLNQQNRGQQAAIGQASQYLGNMLAQRTTQLGQTDYTGLLSQYLGGGNQTTGSMPWRPGGSTSGFTTSGGSSSGYLAQPGAGYTPAYGGSKGTGSSPTTAGTGSVGYVGAPENYSATGPNNLTYPSDFASPGIIAKKNLGAYGKIRPLGPNDQY